MRHSISFVRILTLQVQRTTSLVILYIGRPILMSKMLKIISLGLHLQSNGKEKPIASLGYQQIEKCEEFPAHEESLM